MIHKVDLSYFIEEWYRLSIDEFISYFNLLPIGEESYNYLSRVSNYHNLSNRILFATTGNFSTIQVQKPSIVIGGPCISDCYKSITFEAAMDITNVIEVSKLLDVRGIVYIDVEEEIMKTDSYNWQQVGDSIEDFAYRCLDIMNYNNVQIVRTDSFDIKEIIDDYVSEIRNSFDKEILHRLYEFSIKDDREEILHFRQESYYDFCARTLTTYLPSFISQLNKNSKNQIIVVENSHQIKAVNLAIRLNKKNVDFINLGPFQLVHLPVPDITGKNRMYRSSPKKKIFLDENRESLEMKLAKTNPRVLDYWCNIIPPEVKNKINNPDFISYVEFLSNI